MKGRRLEFLFLGITNNRIELYNCMDSIFRLIASIYICFLFIPTFLNGQVYTNDLIISIIDEELNETLPGVNIYNSDQSVTTISNYNGEANLKGFNRTDSLFFEFTGFETYATTISDIISNNKSVYLSSSPFQFDELVITANSKFAERTEDVPSQVRVIGTKDIEFKNPQTSADMLENTGSVFIQKSQMGGGSPIIRGFEANKVLIVIDGVRMNNAIFRNGHLQNVISIDNSVLDRTEVIFGPASVMYGSDALGGVMHFFTKNPSLYDTQDKKKFNVNANVRTSSANFEKTGHFDFNFGNSKWASLTSVTASDFDNLRSGSQKSKHHPARYGDRSYVAANEFAEDFVVPNPKPRIQLGTEYSTIHLLQKIRFKPNEHVNFQLNTQLSTTTNVPRYDQITEGELDTLENNIETKNFKYSDWDYGPQTRFLISLSSDIKSNKKFFTTAKFLAAYQKIDEDRITRRYDVVWRNIQQENVHVGSFNADLTKNLLGDNLKVLYGVEFNMNRVISDAFLRHIGTGEIDERNVTRYPDGGSLMLGIAGYLSGKVKVGKKANIIGGLRQTYITLTSDFVDTAFFNLPESRVFLSTSALTGGVGFTYKPGAGFNIRAVASSAFRAPNVDDFGKVRSKGGYVTIPNPDLVAEKTLNAELSISKSFNERVKVGGTYFYTYLFDALVRKSDTLANGDATLYFDGGNDTIQRNFNAGEGFIYGLSANIQVNVFNNWKLKSVINYTRGQNITDNSPLSHIPPLYGFVGVSYQYKKKAEFELLGKYNGWKKKERYDLLGSSDNFDKATADGTPPWYTINLYASYNVNKQFTVTFGAENILDQHYRTFSSGVSAPGINFLVSLRGKF